MSQDAALDQAEAALQRGDAAGAEQAIAKQWRDLSKAPGDALHIMAMVRMAQNNVVEGEQYMRSALRAEPNSLRHHIALGHILSAAGKHGEAVDSYTAATRIDPTWPNLYVALAFANYHAGRPLEAERAAMEALKRPSADGWDVLSCALREQGKGREALQAADEALRLDWRHLNAQNSRGAALLMVNRPKEALDMFDAIAAQGVDMPVLAINRGQALEMLGRQSEARALYEDAARRWPNLPNLQERLKAKLQ
ncbi:MAG: tetratricopeptide repeat protein [Hyphomonadaceae bacterium]